MGLTVRMRRRYFIAGVLIAVSVAVLLASYINGLFAFAWSIELVVPPPDSAAHRAEITQIDTLNRRANTVFFAREAAILAVAGVAVLVLLRRPAPR